MTDEQLVAEYRNARDQEIRWAIRLENSAADLRERADEATKEALECRQNAADYDRRIMRLAAALGTGTHDD